MQPMHGAVQRTELADLLGTQRFHGSPGLLAHAFEGVFVIALAVVDFAQEQISF